MPSTKRGVPANSSVVMPRLVCGDPGAAVRFLTNTFEAVSLNERPGPDGKLAHALLTIGPAMIMIEREWDTLPSRAPSPDGRSPVVIFVYVPDVDETVARAVEGGAQVLVPLQDQFWGDRIAWIMDPSGHVWTVASRIEETTAEERTERWNKIRDQGSGIGDRGSGGIRTLRDQGLGIRDRDYHGGSVMNRNSRR